MNKEVLYCRMQPVFVKWQPVTDHQFKAQLKNDPCGYFSCSHSAVPKSDPINRSNFAWRAPFNVCGKPAGVINHNGLFVNLCYSPICVALMVGMFMVCVMCYLMDLCNFSHLEVKPVFHLFVWQKFVVPSLCRYFVSEFFNNSVWLSQTDIIGWIVFCGWNTVGV